MTGLLAPGVAAVVAAAPAEAATQVLPGSVTVNPNIAGASATYTAGFTTSSTGALQAGSTITLTAPSGTVFTACSSSCSAYTVTSSTVASVATPSAGTAVVTLSASSVAASTAVTVTLPNVTNPIAASAAYTIAESTSADTTPATSSRYSIVAASPYAVQATSGDLQHSPAGQAFRSALMATVVDRFGNPETGTTGYAVNFVAPSSGASATFNGSSTQLVTVAAAGTASSAIPVANGTSSADAYTITATLYRTTTTPPSAVPGVTAANFRLTNDPATQTAVTNVVAALDNLNVGATSVTYTVSFKTSAAGALPSNSTISLITPNGTSLPSCAPLSTSCAYGVSYGSGSNAPVSSATTSAVAGPEATVVSTTPNKVVITIGGLLFTSIPASTAVTVTVTGAVTNPTLARTYVLDVSTSADLAPSASGSYTLVPGPATKLALLSGTPQSAHITTSFAAPLVAVAQDQYSNGVPGQFVQYTIGTAAGTPSGTATAVFPNGTNYQEQTTDSLGQSTSSLPIANGTVGGPYNVTASIANTTIPSVAFSLTNLAGAPASMAAVGSSTQSATVHTAYASLLQVVVKDSSSNPVPNVQVAFTAPGSGASGSFAPCSGTGSGATACVVTTDNTGTATASTLTANDVAGAFSVSAAVSGSSTVPAVTFGLTNLPGAPTTINNVSPASQSATVGTAFGTALQVTVIDPYGNAVPGANVSFAAPASGASGTFATCSGTGSTATTCVVATDASGKATATTFTANSTAGAYHVTASAGSATPSSFSLTNTAGPASKINPVSGGGQTAVVGNAYGSPLQVQVVDASGNPEAGVTVVFTAKAATNGATAAFASGCTANPSAAECDVATDASGNAVSSVLTADHTPGAFTVTTTGAGLTGPTFSLTNLPGAPTTIKNVSPASQSATVGTAYGTPLQVAVTDPYGNAVPGANVSFAAPASGASGTFATCSGTGSTATTCVVATDASGKATATTFTANSTAGAYHVTASAGSATPSSFSLTNTASTATKIMVISGSAQDMLIFNTFIDPLSVKVTDSTGNPIVGQAVTFSAPASGATGAFDPCSGGNPTVNRCVITTDSTGTATTPAFTANQSAGTYQVTASIPSGASASFTLTNDQSGYYMVASDGGLFTFGGAPFLGSMGGQHLNAPVVGMAPACNGGYYMVASDGGVFTFGGAPFLGSMGGQHLNAPIVAMDVDPVTCGYWLVASDGGIFAFGAPFYGSEGGASLNRPIVGMAASGSGGYYLVASDGGIFTFGPGAAFYGSTGDKVLNAPIVGMALTFGGGYYLVASDGGIFTFGPGAVFLGSTGGQRLNKPIVGMTVDPATGGYWLVASDGGIFSFGPPFYGSTGGTPLNKPVVGMASSA